MASFARLMTLAVVAATASAASVLTRATCSNPVVQTEFFDFNGDKIEVTTTSCSSDLMGRTDSPLVCGAACTNTCNSNAGNLPPIVDDCQKIKDAVTIFTTAAGWPPSFGVSPGGNKTLTFGTCSFAFVNNAQTDLQYCWTDLSTMASRAGSACFPPVMPLHSEGLCTSFDGTWQVLAAHSPNP